MKRIGFAFLFLAHIALAAIPSTPKLWSETNQNFYDNNGNGIMDLDELITIKARKLGALSVPMGSEYFIHLRGMGFMFKVFIDMASHKSFCPNSTHYQGMNPLFRAIGQTLKVETQGLYIGIGPNEEKIYITESTLKNSWYYMKNGVRTLPNDNIVASVPVFFDYQNRTYQIRGLNELNTMDLKSHTMNMNGLMTTYPPHDRKIGCVPVK